MHITLLEGQVLVAFNHFIWNMYTAYVNINTTTEPGLYKESDS